jgi:NAD(P)-dependent dehydrogenase (short-subunit alcohol dehydrogenase family)
VSRWARPPARLNVRILIAGASGYIGSAIARAALDQKGHAVGAIRRPESTSMPHDSMLSSSQAQSHLTQKLGHRDAQSVSPRDVSDPLA